VHLLRSNTISIALPDDYHGNCPASPPPQAAQRAWTLAPKNRKQRLRYSQLKAIAITVAILAFMTANVRADGDMLDADNLKAFGCAAPSLDYQVVKVGKPGAVF